VTVPGAVEKFGPEQGGKSPRYSATHIDLTIITSDTVIRNPKSGPPGVDRVKLHGNRAVSSPLERVQQYVNHQFACCQDQRSSPKCRQREPFDVNAQFDVSHDRPKQPNKITNDFPKTAEQGTTWREEHATSDR
jgi:hypothetical protein